MTEPVTQAEASVHDDAFALVEVEFTKGYESRLSGDRVRYDKNSAHYLVDSDYASYVDPEYVFVPDAPSAPQPAISGANLETSRLAQVVLTPVPVDPPAEPDVAPAVPKNQPK